MRQDEPGTEGNTVQETVKGYTQKGRETYLMKVATFLLTGMDENEPLEDEDKQKPHDNRQT